VIKWHQITYDPASLTLQEYSHPLVSCSGYLRQIRSRGVEVNERGGEEEKKWCREERKEERKNTITTMEQVSLQNNGEISRRETMSAWPTLPHAYHFLASFPSSTGDSDA